MNIYTSIINMIKDEHSISSFVEENRDHILNELFTSKDSELEEELLNQLRDITFIGRMSNSEPELVLFYNGSLDLSYTSITSLPENLSVDGSLNLDGIPITSLPENLSVGKHLYLRHTLITTLPNSLKINGMVILNDNL